MSQHNNLEKLAYSLASAQVLSELEGQESWYQAYTHLCESVENDEEPNLTAWETFENWPWSDILSHIESEADSILGTLNTVLTHVEDGFQASFDHDGFDHTAGTIDAKALFELGYQLAKTQQSSNIQP